MPSDLFTVADSDPAFVYRWVNQRTENVLRRRGQGFEVVTGEAELPQGLLKVQSTENPTGGTVRQRGDLILMRCPRAVYEEKVLKPRRLAQERQSVTFDTIIQQTNEDIQRRMRAAGLKGDAIRKDMVFREDVE